MLTAASLLAASIIGLASPTAMPNHPPGSLAGSRIRIVPQTSAGLLQDIEESLDGSRLITHDRGYAPRLWDAKRQILLTVLGGHKDRISQVNFSPDGGKLLTLSPTEIRIWDSLRAKTIAVVPAKGSDWTIAQFSSAGSMLLAGDNSGSVFALDTQSPQSAKELGKHKSAITSLAYSPSGKQGFSGAQDGTGIAWDLSTARQAWQTGDHKKSLRWAFYNESGSHVITTGEDDQANVYQATDGKNVGTYAHRIGDRGIENVNMGAQFVGKGDEVVVALPNGHMQIIPIGSKAPVHTFTSHQAEIRELRRSRDGRYLATYASDMTLRIWDAVDRKELPFTPEDGNPTAGEFSPNSPVWWLGYDEGEVRKYNVLTGRATRATYGEVAPAEFAELLSDSSFAIHSEGGARSLDEWAYGGSHLVLNPTGGTGFFLNGGWDTIKLSPGARYVGVSSRIRKSGFVIFDVALQRSTYSIEMRTQGEFSADSSKFVFPGKEGVVEVVDPKTGNSHKAWKFKMDEKGGDLENPTFHPNGDWIVSGNHEGNSVLLWEWQTGTVVKSFGEFTDLVDRFVFSPDGKRLLIVGWKELRVLDVDSGATILNLNGSQSTPQLLTDANLTRIILPVHEGPTEVYDALTGKKLGEIKHPGRPLALSPDLKMVVMAQDTVAEIVEIDSGKVLRGMKNEDLVKSAQFVAGGERVLTVDKTGGVQIWDNKGERLCSMVLMKNGEWLAYDDEGRFDASNPSNVQGAYFVLEWEGGLEPIAMPQLKAQFYDPKLLAKYLGIEDEPLGDVPNLDTLKLYPELTVQPANAEGRIDILAKERDGGGVGRVTAYMNGKQVGFKKGSTYWRFETRDFTSYMLPQSMLPEGRGNELSVTVSNERGDLASSPVTIDLGVPVGLQAPEVKLYALFVGVGDYAGIDGDLLAPPSDAQHLAEAIKQVGEKLLPSNVEVSVLTTKHTDPAKRPTRANILNWFKTVATKATSSDIVMTFFAGHGTSKIGEQGGYFFLTSEANPAEMTASTVGTATISGEDLRENLSMIAANKQVVILDTCHSGAATESLLGSGRSVSGEYQRAWESIKDTTGTWLLAGSAADQLSYESANVDHGMLTYALLEAIDKGSAEGLRQVPSGELFVDVERWLNYAANRVESLKTEVGLSGVQRPEFKRATKGSTFDIGVLSPDKKGFIGLKPPMPIVIVGSFELDEEDPLNLEAAVTAAMRETRTLKPWFNVQKHPNVYRMAGSYSLEGEKVRVRLLIQTLDSAQVRKTVATLELEGSNRDLPGLSKAIREAAEGKIAEMEAAQSA